MQFYLTMLTILTLKQESEIKEKVQKLKVEKKLLKIYHMVVFREKK